MRQTIVDSNSVVRAKVCLVGESAVGKTSLIRRYVLDEFSDEYASTLGTKVMKKRVALDLPAKRRVNMMMTVWDIMGEREIMEVAKESYFHGAGGILAVCDLTREETLSPLSQWIQAARKVVGNLPVMLAANKLDLIQPNSIRRLNSGLESFAREQRASEVLTSAKTGENVEIAFRKLAEDIMSIILARAEDQEAEIEI